MFIDEIQNAPNLIALLRFFYEERPDLHVIAAGSLLEVKMTSRFGPSPSLGVVSPFWSKQVKSLSSSSILLKPGKEEVAMTWTHVRG